MKTLIKNFLLSVALFTSFSTVAFAQNEPGQRIVYDFSFQKDTNDIASKTKDQYALDIFKDHSRFVSFTKLKRDIYIDSMRKAIETQGGIQNVKSLNVSFSGMGGGGAYEIYKFNNGKIRFQQRFLRDTYGYEEDLTTLNWTVTENTEKYGQYNCQLAKVNYGGRNWNALFTTDVPVNNGPYKFSGLPGLIVKMWDDKNQCVFELAEIKNITDGNSSIPTADIVEKKEFKKVEENARVQMNAMASGMASTGAGAGTVTKTMFKDQNGNEITLDQAQRRRAEAEKKNNNRLELN
ncbi:GLPGLI family protein [Niabella sp. 22666]|uniref:GLPGLI family protein n=1 Tax=Niabella sp. 22666 TaxID=3453954 RepID=UPI003F82AE15